MVNGPGIVIFMTASIERGSRMFDVDPGEYRGEAIRVALPADLAVGDDVESHAHLVGYSHRSGVVLGLREEVVVDSPELTRTDSRWKPCGEASAVDQPFGLGIAADE
jgi:hypothetical protein